MADLLIKNAKICDGSGAASFVGYVAVADGKIVEIERGTAPGLHADRTIDADGLVLTPGFIDPHTHYDAQVMWDPLLTCSPWHGVTTVVQGNCAVGVAPLAPHIREIALRDLEHIEQIPYELMASYINGQWETFGEYLDIVQERGVGVNVAPMVPLAPLRQTVMGEACWDRAANDDERQKIANLLRKSLKEGGFGWSADLSVNHVGYGGRPVASRLADLREFEALAQVMAEAKSGAVQINRPVGTGELTDQDFEMLEMIARVSGKTVTYLAAVNTPDNPKLYLQAVNKLGDWLDSGRIVPQLFVKPVKLAFDLRTPFAPGAAFKILHKVLDKSDDEIKALYADPGFRAILQKQIDDATGIDVGYLDRTTVLIGESNEVKALMKSGKSIAQIAKDRSVGLADCWLDIVLKDNLKTEFAVLAAAYEPEGTKNLLRDGRILPGLGDGGAHLQMQNDAGYPTYLLSRWCRDEQVISLEEGVRMMTSFPANVFGIKRRGRLAKGNYADLALIDYENVASGAAEFVHDLPGGLRRVISHARGIEATIVNGQILFERGQHSGALPGKMLRSEEQ